jgi:DNA-binding IclR family transcriptional regulator
MGQHSGIGVIDKTVTILECVAQSPASLAELVERTAIPRATAHRLAVALQTHRLLDRDGEGRFVIGALLGELARGMDDRLVAVSAEVLKWVRDNCGESAQLYRQDGTDRVCVAAAERLTGLRTTVPIGARLPLTAGSGAQILLAWQADTEVAEILAKAEFTQKSLAEVRRRGWAQSIGQREAGVASVSAPVLDSSGQVIAAISISGPIERLGRNPGRQFAPTLHAAAQRLQALLA